MPDGAGTHGDVVPHTTARSARDAVRALAAAAEEEAWPSSTAAAGAALRPGRCTTGEADGRFYPVVSLRGGRGGMAGDIWWRHMCCRSSTLTT